VVLKLPEVLTAQFSDMIWRIRSIARR